MEVKLKIPVWFKMYNVHKREREKEKGNENCSHIKHMYENMNQMNRRNLLYVYEKIHKMNVNNKLWMRKLFYCQFLVCLSQLLSFSCPLTFKCCYIPNKYETARFYLITFTELFVYFKNSLANKLTHFIFNTLCRFSICLGHENFCENKLTLLKFKFTHFGHKIELMHETGRDRKWRRFQITNLLFFGHVIYFW